MNPAARLLALLEALQAQTHTKTPSLIDVWAAVIGVNLPAGPAREDEVTAFLQAVRAELDLVSAWLVDEGGSPVLFEPAFSRFRQVASPTLLHANWQQYRGNIDAPEVPLTFRWSAWSLRTIDEAEFPIDAADTLSEDIARLEASLIGAGLSPSVTNFVKRQIAILRTALRLYKVQGVRAVHQAIEQAGGAAIAQRAVIAAELEKATPEGKSVLGKVGTIYRKAAELCDDAEKIKKGVDVAIGLGQMAKTAWDLGGKYLAGS